MNHWNKFLDQKIKVIAKEKTILDVGGATPFQKHLQPYQVLFKKSHFITVDFNHHYGPSVTADIHRLPFAARSIDALICKAVLEHVYNPFQVVAEMHRVAKKNAPILVYVPFLYPYHGNQHYRDYFRFTHDGLAELFKDWHDLELQHVRGYLETVSFFFPGPLKHLTKLARPLDALFKIPKQTSGYYLFARA